MLTLKPTFFDEPLLAENRVLSIEWMTFDTNMQIRLKTQITRVAGAELRNGPQNPLSNTLQYIR